MKKTLSLLIMSIACQVLNAQAYLVPYTGTNSVTTCAGTVYDHAGTGTYSNNANGSLTIFPGTAGSYIALSFTSFAVETCCDRLYIYDGSSTAAPLIGSYTASPGSIYATNASGTLTLLFTTDGSITTSGFEATISCVTSIPLSDLIIQTPNVTTTSIVAGGSSNINYTLGNQGGSAASANTTGFYLSSNNTWDAGDTFLSSQAVAALGSGLTYNYSSTITIPVATPIGNYYILFFADYTGIINEDIETNNVSSFPITVATPVIDLYVNTTSLSATSVTAGTGTTAYGYVYNQGNTVAPSSSLGYYLSTDLVFDVSDVFLSFLNTTTINAGGNFYASKLLTIPAGTSAGNYYILYFADYPGTISEWSESNNINAVFLTVTDSGKDLTMVTASASPNTIAYGLNTTQAFTALNQSYSTVATSIGFYLSTDAVFDLSDTYLSFTTSSIGANAFYSSSLALTIPLSTAPGSYFILTYIDYTNGVLETNETNNVYATPVTIVAPLIDLLIQTPTLSLTSTASGNSVTATCYINNAGNSTSPSSNVGYYLSPDAIFDAGDIYLNYSVGGTLAALTSSYKSATLTIPAGTTPGNYYVLYFADYTNGVVETVETNNVNYLAITVVAPTIDLTITSPSNPANTVAGGSVLVLCNIFNGGTSSAASSNVGYYLSVDAVFDAGDAYLNYYSGGILTAGASATRNINLTIPLSTPNGNYYILYYADYTNLVIETIETNNVNYFPITIAAPFVDLTITNQSNPINAAAGGSIAVLCNIFNGGSSSATSSNVGYYLSADSAFDAGDTYLNYYPGGTLAAGISAARNTSLTIPLSTPNGNYYILYYADYTNLVSESNESNNVSGFPITIGPGSGTAYLVPFSGTSSITTCDGTVYDHAGTANYSNGANGSLTINPGTVGLFVGLSFTSFALESGYDNLYIYDGTSTAAPLIGTWSGSSSPGNVYATNASGALTLRFYTDGSVTYSGFSATISCVTSVPLSDLIIQNTNTITPSTIGQGGTINATCYIANQSGSSASSSNVGYYLSVDTVWDASDTYLNFSAGGVLGAGLSSYRSITLTIPMSTTPGSYFILFYADYAGAVSESVETNNIRRSALTVTTSIIDLVINTQTLSSSSVPAGAGVVVTCYVLNQGNAPASTSNVAYYISTDTIWDASDVYLNFSAGGTLAAGASSYRSSTLTIPLSTTAGSYYIIYFADYSNSVMESIETNNKRYLPISIVASVIDLSMINYYLSSTTVAKGSTVTANCYIYNQGNVSTSSSNVGFYLSTDSIWSVSDVYLSSYVGGTLNANTFSNRVTSLTIPLSTVSGNYYILYYADYSNVVAESNETNNVVSSAITITNPVVDLLTLSPYSLSSTLVAGNSVSVGATIFNAGNVVSTSSNVGFYLSIDSLFDASDTYLSFVSGFSLNAGSSALRNTTLTIPSSTIAGNYYILYYSDYSSLIVESNETNNVNFYRVSVLANLVDLFMQNPSLSASSVLAGSSITSYSYIYNQGNSAVAFSNVGYYLSLDTVWSGSDVYLANSAGGTLAANTSSYRNVSLLIPAGTANGSYYILFHADYSNLVTETVETNNVSYVPVIVGVLFVDLTISGAIASPLSTTAGSSVSVSSNINNIGTASSTSSNTGYYLSLNNVWDASDTYLAFSPGGTLAAGSTAYNVSSIIIPVATTPGTYYILYFADYSNSVVESIETNNVAFQQISVVVPAADLVTQNFSLSLTTVAAGDTVLASCDILNQGSVAASISSVGFYLSANMVYNASDVFLGYQSGGILSTSSVSARSITATIPVTTTPGSYYILYFADYLDAEDESNETNNVSHLPIIIGTAASVGNLNPEANLIITLFPNPATENINLVIENINENGIISIELLDITGKIIFAEKIKMNSGNKLEKTFDLKSASSGVYFLKVSTEKTVSVKKVVIN